MCTLKSKVAVAGQPDALHTYSSSKPMTTQIYACVQNLNVLNPEFIVLVMCVCVTCVCRSMHKLTQLERLDLGSNEFTEVVSRTCLFQVLYAVLLSFSEPCLHHSSQSGQVSD